MANNLTLSERIVASVNTGKSDPAELAVLDDLAVTGTQINDAVAGNLPNLNVAGAVIFADLPVTDPGVAGQLYLNTGVLTVSTGA